MGWMVNRLWPRRRKNKKTSFSLDRSVQINVECLGPKKGEKTRGRPEEKSLQQQLKESECKYFDWEKQVKKSPLRGFSAFQPTEQERRRREYFRVGGIRIGGESSCSAKPTFLRAKDIRPIKWHFPLRWEGKRKSDCTPRLLFSLWCEKDESVLRLRKSAAKNHGRRFYSLKNILSFFLSGRNFFFFLLFFLSVCNSETENEKGGSLRKNFFLFSPRQKIFLTSMLLKSNSVLFEERRKSKE